MSTELEIYRCGESLRLVEQRPLIDVLAASLTRMLRRDLSGARFLLYLYPVQAPPPAPGLPVVENLMPDYGYAKVVVVEGGYITYQHPHPLDEVIGRQLRSELAGRPDASPETVWGYRVVGPGVPRFLSRPAPQVANSVQVERYGESEAPGFRIRPVPDPEPPLADLSDFAVEASNAEPVKVLVQAEVERQLGHDRPFSEEVEEGGFLVGRVFRDRQAEGTFLVEVTGALPARHTGASLLHLTFTGDSFQEVKRQLRERDGEQLLGWYHTHLFPAAERMGLSTIDLDLHFTTFRKPWQLAGLINLERDGHRTLRFYVRDRNNMELCPQWVVESQGPS